MDRSTVLSVEGLYFLVRVRGALGDALKIAAMQAERNELAQAARARETIPAPSSATVPVACTTQPPSSVDTIPCAA